MDKQIGLGTLVQVDHDEDTNFTTVACVRTLTPPPRSSNQADATCIDDPLEIFLNGVETASDFPVGQFWDPTDPNCQIIDTLKDSGANVPWRIVYPFGTPITQAFSGRVISIVPDEVNNGATISRMFTVRRSTPITYT